MSEHTCACFACSDEIAAYMSLPQRGPEHVAVRFDNCQPFRGATVDGVEVPHVFEAKPGDDGFVLFYQLGPCLGPNYETTDADGKPMLGRHGCRSHKEGCIGLKRGRVKMLLKVAV